MIRTEDEIRDSAKKILGFDEKEPNIKQGTGQITTFNQLGFKGISDKPDGWYLPSDTQDVALILEAKSEKENIFSEKHYAELVKNVEITSQQYKRIVGILYNGTDIRVIKYTKDNKNCEEISDVATTLQNKRYYIALFRENKINKQQIYSLTKKINDCLHIQFGIKNLYHRMIITACALVAKRYGAMLEKGMEYSLMTSSILNTLSKSLEKDRKQNLKLDLLVEVYSEIKMNMTNNQDAIDNFISWVSEISDCVNSDYWNGEDVMGIFFNEFNRYKKKSESGQVFTPDHITSFMYRLIDVNQHDRVLDATCGSGAFLVKAMCNMVKEAGGVNTSEAALIKSSQLFFLGDGNYSSVGMRGGEQILSISKYDSNKGTALHEIGHALGLIHEQQRRDRDEYININWDNIQSDKKSNFKIWEESHAVIKYIPDVLFDYKSIMLYPSYNSFAIDYSKPTMTKKDGSTFNAQRNNLSYIDIVAIYDIYGFPTGGGGPSVTSIK